MNIIISILNYIDIAAPLLTLFFFIIPYKKMAKELHYVFFFVLVQFTTNLAAYIMQTVFDVRNYAAYAANIIFSFATLAFLFYSMNSRSLKKMVLGTCIFFTIVTIYSLSNGDGINSYNSIVSALAGFLITACCLVYFYWKLVKDTKTSGLTNSALFWIIVGIFTYYTGSFFIFISYNYLITIAKQVESIGMLWRFHNVLLTIFCIYTIYGLTCKDYQKT